MKITAFVIAAVACPLLACAEVSTPVTAARPDVDLVIAFNTLQAEKSMDGALWKRIQRDKRRAQRRSRDKSPFNTDGRDIAGVINVSFVSFEPLKFFADGVLCVSGGDGASMAQDVDALSSIAKDMGYVVTVSGNKSPVYSLDMDDQSDEDGVVFRCNGAIISVLDDSKAEFSMRWGMAEAEAKELKASLAEESKNSEPPLAAALEGVSLGDASLAAVAYAPKFVQLPLDGNEEQMALKNMLEDLSTLSICVRVDGGLMNFGLRFVFKDEEAASQCRDGVMQDCKMLTEALKAYGGLVQALEPAGEGRVFSLNVAVDIRSAWELLSRFENSGRPPAKKKKKTQNKDRGN